MAVCVGLTLILTNKVTRHNRYAEVVATTANCSCALHMQMVHIKLCVNIAAL